MTIRFLTSWNGYQPGDVATLANEATLISAGIASTDLDGANDGRIYDAKIATDANGNVTGLVGPDGELTNTKVSRWLSGKNGLLPALDYMDTPPTVTGHGAGSSTITAATGGACSHEWDSGALVFGIGGPDGVAEYSSGVGYCSAQSVTKTDGTKTIGAVARIRFMTDAPEFEIVSAYSQYVDLNLIVDGEIAFRDAGFVIGTVGGTRYTKFSFGSDANTFELLDALTPSTAGTGYAVGDVITLAGGITSDPATVVVVGTGAGGSVSNCKVLHQGVYSVYPMGAIAQASTTGSGTGFAITTVKWGLVPTVRKMRQIEVYFRSAYRIWGINVDASSVVLPWYVPEALPRIMFVGDSNTHGIYLKNAARSMGVHIAHRLGLGDSFAVSSAGGTGWNTDNGTSARWSHANRIADYVAQAPDILVFIGSQNDTQNAALQTAITTALQSISSALPNTIILGIGNVLCTGSTYTKAAFDAVASNKIRYIDNVTDHWLYGTGNPGALAGDGNKDFYVSTDTNHLSDSGVAFFANIAAQKIYDELQDAVRL